MTHPTAHSHRPRILFRTAGAFLAVWLQCAAAALGPPTAMVSSVSTTAARPGLAFGTARPVEKARGDVLTLEQAFQAALLGSRDLEAARDRLFEADIDLDRAWSTLRPSASVVASVTRHDEEVRFMQADGTERLVQRLYQPNISASLRQNIFQGSAAPTLRAVREVRAATKLDERHLRTEVLYAVAGVFYSALAMQDGLRLAERQLEDTAAHLDVVRARVEFDAANRLDLLRAQTDHRAAAEDVRVARSSLDSLKIALATLIGRPRDEGEFNLASPEPLTVEQPAPEQAVRSAIEERDDLASLDQRVTAADHLVTASRMAFLPSLDLAGSARYSPVATFLRDDQLTWQAVLSLNIPIYQGRLRRQQLESAHVRARQARRARESLEDRVRQEVLQGYLSLETATAQLERLSGTAELAKEMLELARARYEVGAATSLDVTDATTRAFVAETQVLGARLDLDMAVLSLARALGAFDELADLYITRSGVDSTEG